MDRGEGFSDSGRVVGEVVVDPHITDPPDELLPSFHPSKGGDTVDDLRHREASGQTKSRCAQKISNIVRSDNRQERLAGRLPAQAKCNANSFG